MNVEEFEKTTLELQKLKKENDKKIDLCDERRRMAKVNSFDDKVITTLGYSEIGYLLIFLGSGTLINNIGVTAFTKIVPALSYSAILIGGSFGIGTVIKSLVTKKYKVKERYKSFSTAKTEAEKLEEKTHYQIELEKACNRNKIIDETLKELESNQAMLNRISSRYDLNDGTAPQTKEEAETKVNELSDIIKEQYDKLDILTTQKVLHDNFFWIRSKFYEVAGIMLAPILAGELAVLFTVLPLLIMARGPITYSSTFASFAALFVPFVAGVAGTGGYMIKRYKDHKKVFTKLNSQLGENALKEVYEKFESSDEEQQELSKLIETQIRDIRLAEVQLQENKRYLDIFTTEEEKIEDTKKQDKASSILENLEGKSVENIVNNTTSFPDEAYRSNYYAYTTDKEEKQDKGLRRVKKRIPPQNIENK